MTTVATAPPARRSITSGSGSPRRRLTNAAATAGMFLSLLIVLVPLVLIIGYVIKKGLPIMSWQFLTEDIPLFSRATGPGMGPAIAGTLLITGAATVMAVPVGVLGGIYLSEYSRGSLFGRVIRFLAETMTGVPSIVMGLFVFTIYTLRFQKVNAFGGALALGCLMLPVIIRTTEEMLKLVPGDLRESSYALGGRKAATIVRVVLPAAASGIVSGVLLAVARAAGETAPLLFTIGIVNQTNWHLFSGANTALSVQIFSNAQSVFPGPQERAWGAALTLIVIVFLFTIAARLVSAFFTRRHASQ
ncbi:MAG TPA: phosphate ABC transporter permease PstA [Acidimicrobiia bacterium]